MRILLMSTARTREPCCHCGNSDTRKPRKWALPIFVSIRCTTICMLFRLGHVRIFFFFIWIESKYFLFQLSSPSRFLRDASVCSRSRILRFRTTEVSLRRDQWKDNWIEISAVSVITESGAMCCDIHTKYPYLIVVGEWSIFSAQKISSSH